MIKFKKMHGLGNDFVIIDLRDDIKLDNKNIMKICDRNFGIGCDQLVLLDHSTKADISVKFFNPDGSESASCGNASRCVAKLISDETGKSKIEIEASNKTLKCQIDKDIISINMGNILSDWKDIPTDIDRGNPIHILDNLTGYMYNIGNPHIIFFNINKDIEEYGKIIENHQYFPNRINVSFADIISRNKINLKVWERGAGITLACGTAACCTAYSAFKNNLCDNDVNIALPGGNINVKIINDEVIMSGKVTKVFEGVYG